MTSQRFLFGARAAIEAAQKAGKPILVPITVP